MVHRRRPEWEERDCAFCRAYQHYGFRHKERPGEAILASGRPIPRGRDVPDCKNCPVPYRWTPENRARYVLYEMAKLGVSVEIDERTAWAFYRLSETERELHVD